MKTRNLFSLAVRLLGLVFLYHGLQAVPGAVALLVSAFPHELVPHVRQNMSFGRFFTALFMVGWPLLVAQWLVRGAPWMMALAYPTGPTREEELP